MTWWQRVRGKRCGALRTNACKYTFNVSEKLGIDIILAKFNLILRSTENNTFAIKKFSNKKAVGV